MPGRAEAWLPGNLNEIVLQEMFLIFDIGMPYNTLIV